MRSGLVCILSLFIFVSCGINVDNPRNNGVESKVSQFPIKGCAVDEDLAGVWSSVDSEKITITKDCFAYIDKCEIDGHVTSMTGTNGVFTYTASKINATNVDKGTCIPVGMHSCQYGTSGTQLTISCYIKDGNRTIYFLKV